MALCMYVIVQVTTVCTATYTVSNSPYGYGIVTSQVIDKASHLEVREQVHYLHVSEVSRQLTQRTALFRP